MTCGEYLALYSELLDERLDVEDELRCRTHSLNCASCARYDHVVRRGLHLVRELPGITPSSQFLHRLQHGILRASDPDVVGRGGRFAASGTVVALAIAGLIAIAAWSPLLQLPDPADRAGDDTAVTAEVDAGRNVRRTAEPPLGRPWYNRPRVAPAFTLTGARFTPSPSGAFPGLAPTEPGPYSPLVVSAPLQADGGADASSRPGQ